MSLPRVEHCQDKFHSFGTSVPETRTRCLKPHSQEIVTAFSQKAAWEKYTGMKQESLCVVFSIALRTTSPPPPSPTPHGLISALLWPKHLPSPLLGSSFSSPEPKIKPPLFHPIDHPSLWRWINCSHIPPTLELAPIPTPLLSEASYPKQKPFFPIS